MDILSNSIKLFQDGFGDMKRSVGLQNLSIRNRCISRIQNPSFREDFVNAPSCTPLVTSSESTPEQVVTSAAKDHSMQPERDIQTKQRQSRRKTAVYDSGSAGKEFSTASPDPHPTRKKRSASNCGAFREKKHQGKENPDRSFDYGVLKKLLVGW